MNTKLYLLISGAIFCVVAMLHLLRMLNQWSFIVEQWAIPLWVSWVGVVIPASLAIWAVRLARAHGK